MLQNAQGCFRVLILAGPKYFEPARPLLMPAQNILGRPRAENILAQRHFCFGGASEASEESGGI